MSILNLEFRIQNLEVTGWVSQSRADDNLSEHKDRMMEITNDSMG